MPDKEAAKWQPPDGFPGMAAFIARDPDSEAFVFRRFAGLTARTLLHRQSELLELEAQLHHLDHEAAHSTDLQLQWSQRNWEVFVANAEASSGHEGVRRRKHLLDDIAAKLKEYHELLVLEHEVAKLEAPSSRVLEICSKALTSGRDDGLGLKLGGRAAEMYDDKADLIALKPPRNRDALSRFLLDHWLFSAQDLAGATEGPAAPRFLYFREKALVRLVSVVSTLAAGVLLIGSILALYFVRQPDSRLALVIVFIVLFAIGLGVTTSASRDAMFAATAAYAAVLVVFVSGNLGTAGGG